MTTLRRDELVMLAGGAGRDRHVAGTFKVLRDVDLEAARAAFVAKGNAPLEHLRPTFGRIGTATDAADFHAWMVAEGMVERVTCRTVDVRPEPGAPAGHVRATVTGADATARRITDDTTRIWDEASRLVLAASRFRRLTGWHQLSGMRRGLLAVLEEHGPDWNDAVRREVNGRYLSRHQYGQDLSECDPVTSSRILRLGWSVARDAPDAVPPGEREFLCQALGRSPDHAAFVTALRARIMMPPRQPTAPETFAFAYAEPTGRGNGAVLRHGTHVIEPVEATEAPVAVRLRTHDPDHDVVIRVIDGVPFRPVLSPGSWRPMTVDAFVEAARIGEAWRDDPFAEETPDGGGHRRRVLGPSEVATSVPRQVGDAVLAASMVARAGRLVSVDGVVHKGCPVPTLRMRSVVDRGGRLTRTLSWRCGPVLEAGYVPGTSELTNWVEGPQRWSSEDNWTRFVSDVPVALAEPLLRAMERLGDRTMQPFVDPDSGIGQFDVADLDPSILPDPSDFLPDLLARYAVRFGDAPSGRAAAELLARVDGTASSWSREADATDVSLDSWRDLGGNKSFVGVVAKAQAEVIGGQEFDPALTELTL